MGNGNIPYFFRIRKFAVGLPLAGNGNISYAYGATQIMPLDFHNFQIGKSNGNISYFYKNSVYLRFE